MVYWASMGRVYLHSRSGAYIKMIAKISSQTAITDRYDSFNRINFAVFIYVLALRT